MNRKTATSPLDWNQALGISEQLKSNGFLKEYLLIVLGCNLGLRIGDLLRITWNDVLNGDEIYPKERKTGKVRAIKINTRVKEAVIFCSKSMEEKINLHEPILSNRWGKSLSVSYVNRRLKWVFERYRVPTTQKSSHLLRKTFAFRVYQLHGESENALVFLSEILNHSSISVTRRYIGITEEKIKEVYSLL